MKELQQDSVVKKNLKETMCRLCARFAIRSQTIISMSEIKAITDTEFDKLYVDLGELDSELDIVESCTDGQDMSKDLLAIVSAPETKGQHTVTGEPHLELTHVRGPHLLFLTPGVYSRPSIYYTNIHGDQTRPGV